MPTAASSVKWHVQKARSHFTKPDKVSRAIKAENILPFHIMARQTCSTNMPNCEFYKLGKWLLNKQGWGQLKKIVGGPSVSCSHHLSS